MMLAFLPYMGLVLIILTIRKFKMLDCRGSIIFGAVIWGSLVTLITEILSLFNLINFWQLLFTWVTVILLLSLFLFRGKWNYFTYQFNTSLKTIPPPERSLLIGVAFIVIVVGIVAWLYPPNNWDSMTYHMSRVMHWIQNRNVEFYPTSNLRELFMNPWAEYAILHLQILNRGDYFANSVQWLCMVGNIVGVTLIAKELKASLRGQILAAVICSTIPMGILQGSSTQTDAGVSFWLVCFVYFVLIIIKKPARFYVFGAGMALGLSILTKATAYLYAFPFLIWLVINLFKNRTPKKWRLFFLIAVMVLFLNSGQFIRNLNLFSNPLEPNQEETSYKMANEVYSLSSVSSNIIRNLALHFSTPFPRMNRLTNNLVYFIHDLIGVSANDERTTWRGANFGVPNFSLHEDSAGNLLHILLILVLTISYFISNPRDRGVGVYFLVISIAAILFCGYLKWQPWGSRLHLPLFVLISPFLGIMLTRIPHYKIITFVSFSFILFSLPYLFVNASRPIAGININNIVAHRDDQYFNSYQNLQISYFEASRILTSADCSNIGLMIGPNSYEYPLKVILEKGLAKSVVFGHVNVANVSNQLYKSSTREFSCGLFTIDTDPPAEISANNQIYIKVWSSNPANIYFP